MNDSFSPGESLSHYAEDEVAISTQAKQMQRNCEVVQKSAGIGKLGCNIPHHEYLSHRPVSSLLKYQNRLKQMS
jgi:hypothetical protein